MTASPQATQTGAEAMPTTNPSAMPVTAASSAPEVSRVCTGSEILWDTLIHEGVSAK